MNKKQIEEVKHELTRPEKKEVIPASALLGTGHTQLSLALSGRTAGGYPKGKMILLAGVSESAKTWLGVSAFAEATLRKEFDDYDLVYDAPEDGASMDKVYFFGQEVERRVRPPGGTPEDPVCSATVEDLYDNLTDLINAKRPFVYVLDSESALSSRAADAKQVKNKKARQGGGEEKGSYGDGKAIVHSQNLRRVRNALRETGSIVIIISQLRENIGMGAMFEPHKMSGGTALKFFSDIVIWTYAKGAIKTKYAGKAYQQGIKVLAKVKKNRVTGKKYTVPISIYHTHGIDDVGDNIDYLIENKHWPRSGGLIKAKEFNASARREDLIKEIEDNNLEKKLRGVVKQVWKQIEEAVAVRRKPRYG